VSLSAALSGAVAGLALTQRATEIASANIQNAATPGYARRTLAREAQAIPGTAVDAGAVTRAADPALQSEALRLGAEGEGSTASADALRALLDALGGGDGSAPLVRAAQDFADGWRLWQAEPEDGLAAREVVARGEALAAEVRRAAQAVEQADSRIVADTSASVDRLDELLDRLAQVNTRLGGTSGADETAAGLADQRDSILGEIATLVEIRVLPRQGGAVAVFTAGGLALLDGAPERLGYDGRTVTRADGGTINPGALGAGRIGALLALRADGSPNAPSSDPGVETLRKLRERLDEFARQFSQPSPGGAGRPPRFADAYDAVVPRSDAELGAGFFVGGNRFDIAVNPELLSGFRQPKPDAAGPVADALGAGGRRFAAGGLVLPDTTLSGMAESILAGLARDTATLGSRGEARAAAREVVEGRLRNATGVNIDAELAQLQLLQTAYAAAARVVTTVQAMFEALDRATAG